MKASKDAVMQALEGLETDEIDMAQIKAALDYAAAQEGMSDEGDDSPAPDAPAADKPDEDEAPMSADEPADEAAASDEPDAPVDAADAPADPVEAADPVDMPEGEAPEDAATMALAPLAEALGTDTAGAAAAVMDNLDAIVSVIQGGGDEEPPALRSELKALTAAARAHEKTIVTLTARAEKAEKALTDRDRKDAEREVDTLLAEGRLTDDVREDFVELCLSARERFDRIVASLPQKVPVGSHATGVTPPEDKTPIPEGDPFVIEHRRTLKGAGVVGDEQDKAIRKRLAAKRDQARA